MNTKILTVIAIIAIFGLISAIVPATSSIYAIHNDKGHADKLSLGECYRFNGDKDFCQDNKDAWKEGRGNN